jgi:endoglucanase
VIDLDGAHDVSDTSRSGRGTAPDGVGCDPAGHGPGTPPRVVEDGTGLDATLWVKNPGESDGDCNSGPPAGRWSPAGVHALISEGE